MNQPLIDVEKQRPENQADQHLVYNLTYNLVYSGFLLRVKMTHFTVPQENVNSVLLTPSFIIIAEIHRIHYITSA